MRSTRRRVARCRPSRGRAERACSTASRSTERFPQRGRNEPPGRGRPGGSFVSASLQRGPRASTVPWRGRRGRALPLDECFADMAESFDLTNGFNALRILCGVFFIPHLFVKFKNQDFVKGFMAKVGLNPPAAWLYAAFAVEIVVTIGLVLDVFTVFAALLAAIFLLVAAWASWRFSEGKWMWNFGGAQYPLFWALCCIVVALEAG